MVLLGLDTWLLSGECPGVSSHLAPGVQEQPHSLFPGSCFLMGISVWCVTRMSGGQVPTPVRVIWVSGGDMVKAEEEGSGRS